MKRFYQTLAEFSADVAASNDDFAILRNNVEVKPASVGSTAEPMRYLSHGDDSPVKTPDQRATTA